MKVNLWGGTNESQIVAAIEELRKVVVKKKGVDGSRKECEGEREMKGRQRRGRVRGRGRGGGEEGEEEE